MDKVLAGRYTAQFDQPVAVFLIGMRVNKFFQFSKWLPVFRAFPEMVSVLQQHPEKGFLHAEFFFRLPPIMPMMLSYWRSFEDLENFARRKDDPHLEAWRQFNKSVGSDGSVGIWHETYMIEPGKYEGVYGNMPAFGMARATQPVPVQGYRNTARGRMDGEPGKQTVPDMQLN